MIFLIPFFSSAEVNKNDINYIYEPPFNHILIPLRFFNEKNYDDNNDIGNFVKFFQSPELVNLYKQSDTNNPPNKPTIEGVRSGKIGEVYDYTISSVDPDGDEVFFEIEWFVGCVNILWEGPYESGEEIIMSNSWNEAGSHIITVRVKDMFDLEGESATFEVSMPKNKDIKPFFRFINNNISKFSILNFFI